jgi:2-polyprenyl-6-methoxyphenol hydroxylase-like FAD-dependent oxidoreductase
MAAQPQVLIVGAGPTGLAAALFLSRLGVPVRIIDAAPEPTRTSKALGVNPRTLTLLGDTGVAAAIEAEGQGLRALRLHRLGRPLATLTVDWAALGVGHRMTVLPQARTEALLTEALAAFGVVPERGLGLTGLSQTADAVSAALSDRSTIVVPVLFAADGAHSTARKALGLGFPGDSWDEPWQLIDVDLVGPAADEPWIDLRPTGPFVCLPLSGTTFRLIGFGPPLLDALPEGWTAGQVRWSSDFHISHRMVEAMTVGRVCLGGDAAHIHSPMGARGMNLGHRGRLRLRRLRRRFPAGTSRTTRRLRPHPPAGRRRRRAPGPGPDRDRTRHLRPGRPAAAHRPPRAGSPALCRQPPAQGRHGSRPPGGGAVIAAA